MFLLLLVSRILLLGTHPNVTRCPNCDNAALTHDLNVVKLLGHPGSASECELLCITYNNTLPGAASWDDGWQGRHHPAHIPSILSGWARCNAYTWFAEGRRCVGRMDDLWAPKSNTSAFSGRVNWPPRNCHDNADCSYNGHCAADHLCRCSTAWRGDSCQLLNLQPAMRRSGVQWHHDGKNISTWGGSVVQVNGTFHMWLSEMVNHCGIDSCTRNSRIVHAISRTGGDGPYEKQEVVVGVSSHEPTVVTAPGGQLVMYFLAFHWDEPATLACTCVNGSTLPDSCPPYDPDDEVTPRRKGGGTWMIWADGPEGPWSEPVLIFQPGQWGEPHPDGTNLAVTILANRSLVGLIKSIGSPQMSAIRLVTASDWQEPKTYRAQFDGANLTADLVFPLSATRNVTEFGLEDPFLWRGEDGIFHALFHQQIEYDDERICGGHAWSTDGITWTYGGTAYSNRVHFQDGSSETYRRRERPHLIFGDSAQPFLPTHLVNGVQYQPGWFDGPMKWLGDGTFTLVQPIAG